MFSMWQGDHTVAAEALEQADILGRALSDDEVIAYAAIAGCMLVVPGGDDEHREVLARDAVARSRELDDLWAEAAAYNALSWMFVARGQFDEESRTVFEATYASASAVGDQLFTSIAEVNLAESDIDRGDLDAAADLLQSCAARHRSARLLYSVGYLLDAAARLALARGDATEAALLLGAADGRRNAIGVAVWGGQLDRRNALVDEVRAAVGAVPFDEAVARGAAFSYDDAIGRVAGPVA
jgi:non-specific serine/threonine protein kinase